MLEEYSFDEPQPNENTLRSASHATLNAVLDWQCYKKHICESSRSYLLLESSHAPWPQLISLENESIAFNVQKGAFANRKISGNDICKAMSCTGKCYKENYWQDVLSSILPEYKKSSQKARLVSTLVIFVPSFLLTRIQALSTFIEWTHLWFVFLTQSSRVYHIIPFKFVTWTLCIMRVYRINVSYIEDCDMRFSHLSNQRLQNCIPVEPSHILVSHPIRHPLLGSYSASSLTPTPIFRPFPSRYLL